VADPDQEKVVKDLDTLWLELQQQRQPTILQKIRGQPPESIPGLYIWGSVGRGKTWLMDLFFENLPVVRKQRIHFHRFMYRVHAELKTLKNQQYPLKIIGQKFAQEAQVLCFDEFFVSDITDAMLLAGLLETRARGGRAPQLSQAAR